MATFDLYLDLSSVYTSTAPTFEVLIDGVVVSSISVTSTFTPITLSSLSYSGDAPGYLSFRFNDANGEVDRSVDLNEIRINGVTVGTSSLSKLTILQGQESQLDTAAEQASFGIPGPGAGTDAIINGTAGVDNLNGTSGNDTINGLGDRDWIKGNDGIDTINGGAGHDIIRGGDGDDIINGDADNDLIKGEGDNDTINGGLGHDTLDGGDGTDTLNGDDGNDVLKGGAGIDTLHGNNDNDKLFGGDDGDFIYGDAGNDKGYGENGNDTLYGGSGNDTLFGGAGVDIVDGEGDNDRLYGDAGNDTLYGRAGNDKIFGGADNDTIFGGTDNDKLFGEDGDDTINGEDGNDRIVGGAGIDTINGGDGIDNIDGNDGNDIINGGLMGDLIKGGDGDDTINGDDGDDNLYGQEGNDTINGGSGNDFIYGKEGNNNIDGGIGTDTINGGSGNDTIEGGTGTDIINAGDGNDTILAGAEGETLRAGAGADIVDGGGGNDTIHGHGLSQKDIDAVLNANPSLVYYSYTNSFYQFVATTTDAVTAAANARATVINGAAGHLGVITSQTEYDFILANITDSYWLNGGDYDTTDVWLWDEGAEAGIQWSQGATGVNNMYENWAAGQPNDPNQHYTYIWSAGGGLADATAAGFTHTVGYVVEWDAGLMNADNAVDTLNGDAGDDMLYGYGGDDILDGGADNDVLIGGEGNDTLEGGSGDDALFGQNGTDTASFTTATGGVTANLQTGTATGHGTDTLNSIENLTGSDFADTLTGDDNANVINGGDGNDIITGGGQTKIEVNATTLLSYGGGQDVGGTINYMDDDVGVELDGNLWKKFLVNYTVTANTVIEFDFRSTNEAEISGIGFDNDNNIDASVTFEVYGTQTWGNQTFNNYDGSGNWTHYEINVGAFYTGTFSHLFIVNDDDGGGDDGEGYWRNIVIHEGGTGGNTLSGGDGVDELYGDSGLDTFLFEDTNDIDIIHNFNLQDGDILDLSTINAGYTGAITDFIQFTNSGDHVTVSVDVNGTTGGANFVDIAELRGHADLDEATLLANGNIVT